MRKKCLLFKIQMLCFDEGGLGGGRLSSMSESLHFRSKLVHLLKGGVNISLIGSVKSQDQECGFYLNATWRFMQKTKTETRKYFYYWTDKGIKGNCELDMTLCIVFFEGRISNVNGFYLRAIASPVNSSQFRAIARNSKTVARNSTQSF